MDAALPEWYSSLKQKDRAAAGSVPLKIRRSEGGMRVQITLSRRRFLTTVSLAGAASVIRVRPVMAAEGPPETTAVRLAKLPPGICIGPQYVADDLLRAEGFTDIQYVLSASGAPVAAAVASGSVDFSLNYAGPNIIAVDAGEPLVILAGVHVGCFELFGHEGIRSITDLKGKSVGVQPVGSSQHVYLATMLAYIGRDPDKDITWVTSTSPKPSELFASGKVDAFLGFAPEPQDLRARHIGHVVVNSAVDRPWSQYFCCMLIGNREFIRKYPVATNGYSAPSLRRPISARLSRSPPRDVSSMAGLPRGMTMRCKRSTNFRMTNGGNTIPRTQCAFMRYGCARPASSSRARRRSSPTARIGVF